LAPSNTPASAGGAPRSWVIRQDHLGDADGFTDRPGLEGAATRRVRRLRVEELGGRVETRLVQVREERRQESCAGLRLRLARAAADADPGVDERAQEPRPDGALMIRGVALADAALVVRRVVGRARREGAEADRRLEACLDGVHDPACLLAFDDREGQAA